MPSISSPTTAARFGATFSTSSAPPCPTCSSMTCASYAFLAFAAHDGSNVRLPCPFHTARYHRMLFHACCLCNADIVLRLHSGGTEAVSDKEQSCAVPSC